MSKDEIVEGYLLNKNSKDYNIDKTIEESVELADVLLKYKNKEGSKRPSRKDVAGEIADLLIRIGIIGQQLELEELISKAFDTKIDKLHNYIKEGKYVNI